MDSFLQNQPAFTQQDKLVLERLFKNGLFSAICQLPNPGRFINDPPLSAVLATLRGDFSKFDQMVKTFPLLHILCNELLARQARPVNPFNSPLLPSRVPQFSPIPPPPPVYSNIPTTPAMLHTAARDGNLYRIQEMLKKDSVIIYEGDDVGYNVLHIAAQHGRFDVVKYLVETMHMDVNCISLPGYTPLILASMEGHAKIVAYFMKNGANIYQADSENKTAIDYALIFNHEEVIKALFPDERERLKLSSSGEIPVIVPEVKQPEPKPVQSPPQAKKDPWWDEPAENNTNTKDTPVTENWEDLASNSEKSDEPLKTSVNNNTTSPTPTTTESTDTVISFSSEEQTRLDQLVDSIFGANTPTGPLDANESDVMLLIRRIVHLERDLKTKHDKINKLEEQSLCCICMDKTANVVLLECNHLIVCHDCTTTKQLKQCPVCNSQITRVLKIFHAS